MYPSGFNSLPVELCEIIVYYTQSLTTVSRLSQTCHRNYSIFIPFLYSKFEVDQRALSTLSLSSEQRALPRYPHPASFVKDLHLGFDASDDPHWESGQGVAGFLGKAQLVLRNLVVEKSGGKPSPPPLKRLSVDAHVSFPRLVDRQLDVGCFRNLVSLSLVCEFPEKTVKKSLSILRSFENQNLTSLHLGVLECRQRSRTLKPQHLSKLLDLIANTFTNLTFLGLDIPISKPQGADPINEVLKKMNFPSLRSFLVKGSGAVGHTELDFLPFLANHPLLESLQYFSSRIIPDEVVPKLQSFTGDEIGCIGICHSERPISEVNAHFDDRGTALDLTDVHISRRFSLTCSAKEVDWFPERVLDYVMVCSQIVHLDLEAASCSLPVLHMFVLKRLPNLETLKVYRHFRHSYINGSFDASPWLRMYAEEVVLMMTPRIRQVTVEVAASALTWGLSGGLSGESRSRLKDPEWKETFVLTVHSSPQEKGVGRVVKGLAVRDGARLELDVDSYSTYSIGNV